MISLNPYYKDIGAAIFILLRMQMTLREGENHLPTFTALETQEYLTHCSPPAPLRRSGYLPLNQPSFFCIFLLTGKIPFKGKLRASSVIIIVHSVLELTKHFSSHCLSHFFLVTTLKNRQGRSCAFRFYKAGS